MIFSWERVNRQKSSLESGGGNGQVEGSRIPGEPVGSKKGFQKKKRGASDGAEIIEGNAKKSRTRCQMGMYGGKDFKYRKSRALESTIGRLLIRENQKEYF